VSSSFCLSGSGDLSKPIYCQTEEDIPGAPEQVKAVRTASSILVCWTPPVLWEQNGQLLKYSVYMLRRGEVVRSVMVPPNITRIEVIEGWGWGPESIGAIKKEWMANVRM